MIRNLFLATAVVAVTCLAAAPVSAQYFNSHPPSDLFSQYATPGGASMTTAGMYPAPHYSPALGAQSYYTYQPLMPHEMMYQHSRNYYNYSGSDACGFPDSVNKTSVRWFSGTNHIGQLKRAHGMSDFGYRVHSRKYGLGGCENGSCDSRHFHRRKNRGQQQGSCDTCASVPGGSVDSGCTGGCAANLSDGSLRR